MKITFILSLVLPVLCFSQQPSKPVVQSNVNTLSIDLLNADLPMINEMIKKTNEQIRGMKDEVMVMRVQQNTIASQRQKAQFEIQQLENKTNRSQEEVARLNQLKNETKVIDAKIEQTNQFIKEQSEAISLLEINLQLMEEKLKELDQKEKNQQKKEQTIVKPSANDLKNDPVKLYARVKVLLDSLPEAEKAKLSANQIKTLGYYTDLYNSNSNFKSSVLIEIQTSYSNANADQSIEKTVSIKNNLSAMLSKLKEYLDRLGETKNKNQL